MKQPTNRLVNHIVAVLQDVHAVLVEARDTAPPGHHPGITLAQVMPEIRGILQGAGFEDPEDENLTIPTLSIFGVLTVCGSPSPLKVNGLTPKAHMVLGSLDWDSLFVRKAVQAALSMDPKVRVLLLSVTLTGEEFKRTAEKAGLGLDEIPPMAAVTIQRTLGRLLMAPDDGDDTPQAKPQPQEDDDFGAGGSDEEFLQSIGIGGSKEPPEGGTHGEN